MRSNMNKLNDNTTLECMSPRDKVWDKHKYNAQESSRLFALNGNKSYALRISLCAIKLDFMMQTSNSEGELELKLKTAQFCRVKLCPICQWRRTLMWKAKAYKILPKLLEDYPTTKYIFLTLTVKNVSVGELRSTIDWMNCGWRKLVKRKCFPAVGWVKTIEVTRNERTNSVHPHIHALLAVKSSYYARGYIKQSRWQELWKESLKIDYLPVVDVRRVNDLQGSIPEIFKYTTKEYDNIKDANYLAELSKQLHNCRMINTGGILREYFSALENDDDLVGSDDELNLSEGILSFNWNNTNNKYTFKE